MSRTNLSNALHKIVWLHSLRYFEGYLTPMEVTALLEVGFKLKGYTTKESLEQKIKSGDCTPRTVSLYGPDKYKNTVAQWYS